MTKYALNHSFKKVIQLKGLVTLVVSGWCHPLAAWVSFRFGAAFISNTCISNFMQNFILVYLLSGATSPVDGMAPGSVIGQFNC